MASITNSEPQLDNRVNGRVKSEPKERLIALHLAIDQGIADTEAGRIKPISDVAARLAAKYNDRS
ncbi:type II toxin-antitoxin system ParD family antitoxin [Rhizobium leguminosarum]|jgi:antitoxin ParD1/3/4|uniref:Type II toxin-antitoxin system ParD family antitoxin n=2 Tax=Rhizobium TaxID=379 RepID=A0ABZ0ZHM7_9HYPH|nr:MULTISPECIES: hypothetical protein [Rhizobium]MBA9030626.1 antitoxin ParD1/3/4 [Rhizobium leguminosarum]MBP2488689.1 antitoxin ParD1/3/4 [Rhizobium leguminosarum]MDV4160611.1 type II toxin-antitoxin system ParD family antitoxin [Rhizobium leguminosarum]MDV4170340.1 type II toxin-antitoxin system ParD family antitoxin [Rhizobium leguminosarum]NKK44953.1 type II toxin-antitoxin system ParD family antitoxin [Rhizobium leguminosarum bv. viciae]